MTATDWDGRLPAGFGARAVAAAVDAAVGYGLLALTSWLYLFTAGDPSDGVLPTWIGLLALAGVWLYFTVTTHRGATLGMEALSLHLIRVDTGAPPSLVLAAVRAVPLVGVGLVWLLWSSWWLVGAYLLSMFLIPGRQLPHDLMTRTAVVRHTPLPLLGRLPRRKVRPPANLPPEAAKELLDDLERLRERPQRELHLVSVPMIILGVISLAGGLLDIVSPDSFMASGLFWAMSTPIALVATALWYFRQRRNYGVTVKPHKIALIVVLTGVSILAGLMLFGGLVGLGFLALAIDKRSLALAIASAVFTMVNFAEHPFMMFSNLLGVPGAAGTALGAVLIGIGVYRLRHEQVR
ncbi:MAG TPA: RDD family protein [Mycobacteriales bacterium]|nr:RDD family protein [Mycobacteriales bacterium]